MAWLSTFSIASAAGPEPKFDVFVDPELPQTELPAAPSKQDRLALLASLQVERPICPMGADADHEEHGDWRQSAFSGLSRLELEGDRIDGLAHIALTERMLSGEQLDLLIEFLASRRDPAADRRVVQLVRFARVIAKRMVPKGIEASIRPLAENSTVIDIRTAALGAAAAWGSDALVVELESL